MRTAAITILVPFAAFVFSGVASAGPQLSTDQIVKHFVDTADLGAKRGICIGTTDECAKSEPAPTGLDMLINFDLNSAELTGQARENLNEFAKALRDERLQAATFVVEGYTDASGEERYNTRLSERRAEAVSAFLLANGISLDKVQAIGMGEQNPRVPNPYDPVNRRVEMRVKVQ